MEPILETILPSLLNRPSFCPAVQASPIQGEIDGWVGGFIHQATDWRSLAAMVAGGMAYRVGRVGVMGLGNVGRVRALSIGVGLTAEVSTFEMTHRGLTPLSGRGESNLWRWSGSGGLRQGLFQSFITFGSLKGAGRLARGENLVIQHLFQDSALVLGHQAAGAFGIAPRPAGNLAEQFLQAEATTLQLGAGMALAGRIAPGMHSLERGLDVHLSSSVRNRSRPQEGSGMEWGFAFALESLGLTRPLRPRDENPRDPQIFFMEGGEDGEGNGRSPPIPDLGVLRAQIEQRQEESREILKQSLSTVLKALMRRTTQVHDSATVEGNLRRVEALQVRERGALEEMAALLERAKREEGRTDPPGAKFFQDLEWRYSRLYRTREQIACALRTLSAGVSAKELYEIRRRLEWVLSTPEFEKEFLWQATLAVLPPFDSSPFGRFEKGLNLLMSFHPDGAQEDLQIYTFAAQGPIRGREIAFDVDKTIAESFLRPEALDLMGRMPHAYDVKFEYLVHQYHSMRVPYRGMQALLLGLWAAGNRLKIYTGAENLPHIHNTFFNDFPLLKIAFEFTTPSDLFRRLTPEDLHQHPHFMDSLKRKAFQIQHLDTLEGREMLRVLRETREFPRVPYLWTSKIPLPGFNFDVLVDDKDFFANDMQRLGFGRRWILADGSVGNILEGLQAYFFSPRPQTSEILRRWLGEKDEAPAASNVVSLAARLKPRESSAALKIIHEAFALWAADLDVVDFDRQWQEFEFRIHRRPPEIAERVAQLIRFKSLAARVLLLSSGLIPSGSFLASDTLTERALFHRAEENISPEVFDSNSQKIWKRLLDEVRRRSPFEEKRLTSLSENARRERAGRLPVTIFQAMSDPELHSDLFYHLAEHFGLKVR